MIQHYDNDDRKGADDIRTHWTRRSSMWWVEDDVTLSICPCVSRSIASSARKVCRCVDEVVVIVMSCWSSVHAWDRREGKQIVWSCLSGYHDQDRVGWKIW